MPKIAIAAISRLLAIGRLMKISEIFIGPPLLNLSAATAAATSASTPAAATAPGSGAAASIANLHLRACLETKLPLGDDCLSCVQAFFNHDVVADALADGDCLLIHRAVILHDEHELAFLSRLHRLTREHERVRQRCDA